MSSLKAMSACINENLLFIMCLFLLAFIPLFPKIPLFDILPGYIVRVRIEDFLVIATGIVWLRDVFKRKVQWNTSYFWIVVLYAILGLLSIFIGIVLLRTIPPEPLHIGKSGLHFFRYLEYFSLFFFCLAAIKKRWQLVAAFLVIVVTMLGVVTYGVGQKYARFPVYSTMNREYSKGEKLYLQEGARPQSTFAGHYDLAAYLVIILPLIFSVSLGLLKNKSIISKILSFLSLQLVHALGVGMLLLSSSKTAIVAYGVALATVIMLHIASIRSRKWQFIWASITLTLAIVTSLVGWIYLPTNLKIKVLGLLPRAEQTARELPSDLIGTGYEEKIVTKTLDDGTVEVIKVFEKQTWSPNALKYGLSMGIRLDTLWPNALLGLARSPLTGSGYGTLATMDSHAFSEADSTDNNFLRTLGETGILGFVCFYGFILFIIIKISLDTHRDNTFIRSWTLGFSGSIVGLLLTAIYLDVFAASKVAFIFWAISGLTMSNHSNFQHALQKIITHLRKNWVIYITTLLVFFVLHQNPYMENNPTKDIDTQASALAQITTARCFLKGLGFSLCRNDGQVLKSSLTPYSVFLTPLLSITSTFGVYYYLNLTIILIFLVLIYLYYRKRIPAPLLFLSLSLIVCIASLLGLSSRPFANFELAICLALFPLLPMAIRRIKDSKFVYISLTVLFMYILFFSNIRERFQNISPNISSHAVLLANNMIHPNSGEMAYLITTLNPYFVDLYNPKTYKPLPLSTAQPYANQAEKVWGVIPKLSELKNVFVSDYGIMQNTQYLSDFNQLKKDYNLRYHTLGCDEQCSLYTLEKAKPIVSDQPISPFDKKTLKTDKLTKSYSFVVLSNRYEDALASHISSDTQLITYKLAKFIHDPFAFMIITGDAEHKPEKIHADVFINGFVQRAAYPVLYTAGNEDLIPEKYTQSGYQTFFTSRDYFILLPVESDSSISLGQKLNLYNTFLELEKLPEIRNLFIISHNLDWQNQSNSSTIVSIKKKLAGFKDLNTYVVTSNHDRSLSKSINWFTSRRDGYITYVASLTAGNINDDMIKISIDENEVISINELKF